MLDCVALRARNDPRLVIARSVATKQSRVAWFALRTHTDPSLVIARSVATKQSNVACFALRTLTDLFPKD